MKIGTLISLIVLGLTFNSHAEDYLLFQSSNYETGEITQQFSVDIQRIKQTPSWDMTEPIPLSLEKVISIVLSEFPELKINRVKLEKILGRNTPETKDIYKLNKWYYTVNGFQNDPYPLTLVILLDGSVVKPTFSEQTSKVPETKPKTGYVPVNRPVSSASESGVE